MEDKGTERGMEERGREERGREGERERGMVAESNGGREQQMKEGWRRERERIA